MILIAAMQQIGMEKEHVARAHFIMQELLSFLYLSHTFWIRTGLLASQLMVNASARMGTPNDLQASVFSRRGIDGNETADQVRR